MYALAAARHMQEHGTTREQKMAEIPMGHAGEPRATAPLAAGTDCEVPGTTRSLRFRTSGTITRNQTEAETDRTAINLELELGEQVRQDRDDRDHDLVEQQLDRAHVEQLG